MNTKDRDTRIYHQLRERGIGGYAADRICRWSDANIAKFLYDTPAEEQTRIIQQATDERTQRRRGFQSTDDYRRKAKARHESPAGRETKRKTAVAMAEKYPEKLKCRYILKNAIAAGTIIRQPCEVCAAEPAESHHEDYSKPFDVKWLCFTHHRTAEGRLLPATFHRRLREGKPLEEE